jgi:hypothetical protein
MSARIKRRAPPRAIPQWHASFLSMLPAIRRSASISFRFAGPELRGDLIAEVVANSCAAYARLVELGKAHVATPSALARYAVAQVQAGRRVGNRLRVRDALSAYAQCRKQFIVERLDRFDEEEREWQQMLIEDRRAGPAEIVACRIDFADWLRRLTARLRRIALALASGHTTAAVAKMFAVSPARISQLRELLRKSWEAFQGGPEIGARPQPVAA